jgi:hypothetical protein
MKAEDVPQAVNELEPYVAYAGEVMLIGADWSHQNGHTAKLMFEDSDLESNPMAEHTLRRSKRAGTRFHIILIEIQDDDAVINQDKREVVEKATDSGPKKKVNRIRNAALLCKDSGFWGYLMSLGHIRENHSNQFKEDIASEYVRRLADIKTRSDLGTDDAAWQRFNSQVVQPFHDWERDNG